MCILGNLRNGNRFQTKRSEKSNHKLKERCGRESEVGRWFTVGSLEKTKQRNQFNTVLMILTRFV